MEKKKKKKKKKKKRKCCCLDIWLWEGSSLLYVHVH
jgi:hypothetical protein